MRQINKIIVHWSGAANATFDSILNYHVNVRNYKDIGYHYVIDRYAKVRVGRPITQIGAHCKGQNIDSVGICVIADNDNEPTAFQIQSLQLLIEELLCDLNLHWENVWCHSDFAKTLCPGELLRQFVHNPFKFEYD